MFLSGSLFLIAKAGLSPSPQPSISYFTNLCDVSRAVSDHPNYILADEEVNIEGCDLLRSPRKEAAWTSAAIGYEKDNSIPHQLLADLAVIHLTTFSTSPLTVTGNLNRWFGITADFSGAYKSQNGVDLRNYTYTFGPVVSIRPGGSFTPFAHALFGGFHASAAFGGFSGSVNGFASFLGGGVDIKVAPHVALRAVQADWLLAHAQGATSKSNARISTGLVFRF